MTWSRLRAKLASPVDVAGLAAFRIAFGLIMALAMIRGMQLGWVEEFYGLPEMHFKFWGFSWVEALPVPWMYALYSALALCGLCVALGLFYRVSAALFFLGFTYVELIDVTNYLNHYYLVTLVSLLLVFVPAHRRWSIDAWRNPALRGDTAPAWSLYLMRFQIGTVYVFAGLAKLGSDWLLHAQPLGVWLAARTDTAVIGPWLDEPWVAYAASWAGFLFDTTIVLWLSWRKSRPVAYLAVIAFHAMTHVFFDIGLFPIIMIAAATIFFAPGWPRRFLGRFGAVVDTALPRPAPPRWQAIGLSLCAAYLAVQVALPLRHFLYPGDVIWNEEGMRWAWKVMVREKHGAVTYRVRFLDTGKQLYVEPHDYLTPKQEWELAGQPDLILQLAHRIADDFEGRGMGPVAVHADAMVSLNGRPARRLVDPEVDLSRVEDGLARAHWIAPEPTEPPIHLRPARLAGKDAP